MLARKSKNEKSSSSSSNEEGKRSVKNGFKPVMENNSSSEEDSDRSKEDTPRKKLKISQKSNKSSEKEINKSKKKDKEAKEKIDNSSGDDSVTVLLNKRKKKNRDYESVKPRINLEAKKEFNMRPSDNSKSQIFNVEKVFEFSMVYGDIAQSGNRANPDNSDYQSVPRMIAAERAFKIDKPSLEPDEAAKVKYSILFFGFLERLFVMRGYVLRDFAKAMKGSKSVLLFKDVNKMLKADLLLAEKARKWWEAVESKLENLKEGTSVAVILREEKEILSELTEVVEELLTTTSRCLKIKNTDKLAIFSKVFMTSVNTYTKKGVRTYSPDILSDKDRILPEDIFDAPLTLIQIKTSFSLLYTEKEAKELMSIENGVAIKESIRKESDKEEGKITKDDAQIIVESVAKIIDMVSLMTEGLYEFSMGGLEKFHFALQLWNDLLLTIQVLPAATKTSPLWMPVNVEVGKLAKTVKHYSKTHGLIGQVAEIFAVFILHAKRFKNLKCFTCNETFIDLKKEGSVHFHKGCFNKYFSLHLLESSKHLDCRHTRKKKRKKSQPKRIIRTVISASVGIVRVTSARIVPSTYALNACRSKPSNKNSKLIMAKELIEFACECNLVIGLKRLAKANKELIARFDSKFGDDFSLCQQCGKPSEALILNCGHNICQSCAKRYLPLLYLLALRQKQRRRVASIYQPASADF
eukprot:TRINITY_DN7265_c0_g3_i8.p1 TRINITY_DN7265_c0_g3~~TRINITY_DN7265_c0_g3_i8.p1  ORF type:complete len:694 (-),score=153.71 TRINITY_DN7265_c0_g3_i8:203-2284(-)